MTIKPEIKEKNCHAPHDKLAKYMSEKAYLLRRKEVLNLRMETKKKLSGKELEELQYNESRSKTLANTKRQILHDFLFPAMANLTFFFEVISQYPELEQVFKFDIMDLLGVRRLDPDPKLLGGNYAFMFEALIRGMLNLAIIDNDYRIRLLNTLQELIRLKLHDSKIFDTFRTTDVVYGDIGRAQAWTDLLATRVKDVYNFSIKTNPLYGEKEEERLEAFEKDKSKHFPDRTFIYNTKELMEWKSKTD